MMNFYIKENEKFRCLLCNHTCLIPENEGGICGVNINSGEKIECVVYGYPKALNIDPVEKKPLYHFLPTSKTLSLGTVGCNFKCSFCQNWRLSQRSSFEKDNYYSPEDIVQLALKNHCKSISFTYNEPTIFYPYAKDIAIEAKKNGLKNIFVSNGFESSEMIDDMKGLIDAVNIDLKCFDETYYKKLGGKLDVVLRNIEHFYKNGIWIEITTLIVPTKNDTKSEIEKIANFIASLDKTIPWHLSAFHPSFKEEKLPNTPVDSLKMAFVIGKSVGLEYVYLGNVGINNSTICKKCGNRLISRISFDVLHNSLENGNCNKCGEKLDGVFE